MRSPAGRIDYVLPLRWTSDADRWALPELTDYLRQLAGQAHPIVVDGSPPELFDRHAAAWRGLCTHVPPEPLGYLNGKVNGVTTGLRLATAEHVVVADDDVRYDAGSLARVVALLDDADLVGPQNVFVPMPWHACWDTARSLLNRSFRADYPGTFAVRRSTFLAMGGYDGDVLFENLELMRTVRAAGGRVLRPLDVYVARVPCDARRFRSQRVRQAYDDLAQPARLVTSLAVLPAVGTALARHRLDAVLAGAAATVALAELGRRRAGGRAVFPARASWYAPAWVLERAVCSWVALGARVARGGVPYAGTRLAVAAHSAAELRRRAARPPDALVAAGGPEADRLVRAVAERLEAGAPAPAQRHGAPSRVDPRAVGAPQDDVAAHDERSVLVRGDDGRRRGGGPVRPGVDKPGVDGGGFAVDVRGRAESAVGSVHVRPGARGRWPETSARRARPGPS